MTIFKRTIGTMFVLAAIGASPAFAATDAVDAAGNIQKPVRPAFIENPNPKGPCLKILVPGIRCPIPNPAPLN